MAELLTNKVRNLAESGRTPEDIIKLLQNEEFLKTQDVVQETFPDEIKIISQALSFRSAESTDCDDICTLINQSYACETTGDEAFRVGDCVTENYIQFLMSDAEFHWLLLEAPNGRAIEADGLLLGVCCYTTSGVSRRNGEVEGSVGSIRFLCVRPRYRGLCVGLRLLQRVEGTVRGAGCVRVMASVPSPRVSVMAWLRRRGYVEGGAVPYPVTATGHVLSGEGEGEGVRLVIFHKSLLSPSGGVGENGKDDVDGDEDDGSGDVGRGGVSEGEGEGCQGLVAGSSASEVGVVSGEVRGNGRGLALPPHWRSSGAPLGHHSESSSTPDSAVAIAVTDADTDGVTDSDVIVPDVD